jgi:hypothetical protein
LVESFGITCFFEVFFVADAEGGELCCGGDGGGWRD